MFADEARFGRMNRLRPCWAPIGTRPEVAAQLIREYIYLYGAVSPKDGTCVYLIMPTSNTACFQAFLHMLARRFARQDILLVLDGAPNHRCGDCLVATFYVASLHHGVLAQDQDKPAVAPCLADMKSRYGATPPSLFDRGRGGRKPDGRRREEA